MRRVALLSVILMACTPLSTVPSEESSPPAVFGERPAEAGTRGIEIGECPAKIADEPTPYFGGKVLLRLPAAMSPSDLLEYTPGVFARNPGPIASKHCRAGRPSAVIRFVVLVGITGPEPGRSAESVRDRALEAIGYPDERKLVEQASDANLWVFEIPIDESAGRSEPAKILVTMRVTYDKVYLLVFEVNPEGWPGIVDSLVASAQDMTVLSP